jgi:hypothetical protein
MICGPHHCHHAYMLMSPFAATGTIIGNECTPFTSETLFWFSTKISGFYFARLAHYNNKHKTTTDSIHPNSKKHIRKKSLLTLPTAHAFSNFAHTSSGHAAVQEDFSGCERSGSYNNSNTEEEYDDVDNNQLFLWAVTKDFTTSHFSETRIQPLKLNDDATLDDGLVFILCGTVLYGTMPKTIWLVFIF